MTAAARALIAEGFQLLDLNCIQAQVGDRAGLKKEGVLRQAEWLYDHYVDLMMKRRSENRVERTTLKD
jgi:ribosomal-protein-serine acetyltransferase